MMKIIILVAIFLVSTTTAACGYNKTFEFGLFNPNLGDSVSKGNSNVTISTNFVKELIITPTGTELRKNRDELFYLISKNTQDALYAGIKVFINLLSKADYISECDTKRELWNKEEVAFIISRNQNFHEELCRFNKNEWNLVVDFYEKHPKLWGMVYDPPWIDRDAYVCQAHK